MSAEPSDDESEAHQPRAKTPAQNQVTLTQMLKALDKDVAVGVERKLKKLSKKKAIKVPLEKHKADLIKRQAAYSEISKEITKWEPTIKANRRKQQLTFPLDSQPDILPTAADSVADLRPSNKFEQDVQGIVCKSSSVLHDDKELSKAEEKYLNAISSEQAEARHQELQRMRVLLSSYAAKMRRQKKIKSKSYRRLLKQEKIKKHVKKVESDNDLLMDEINKLKKIRAHERASLRHKNTGKWAKHAKFRAKYDEQARQAMIDQIGLAETRLKRPADLESDSDVESEDEPSDSDYSEDDDNSEKNDDNSEKDPESDIGDDEMERRLVAVREQIALEDKDSELINTEVLVSNEPLSDKLSKRRQELIGNEDLSDLDDDDEDEDEDEQRKLIREAFSGDDVVTEFRKAKDAVAGEEQPKDINRYLPGWGDWAGPGIKVNKRKRSRYLVKAKKLPRRDDKIGHVIISEQADDKLKDLMMKRLPPGVKSERDLKRTISKPITATFVPQTEHRRSIMPTIRTKLGARIEPINKSKVLQPAKAKWVRT